MTIEKLKIDGGTIVVEYSNYPDFFKIETNDEAKPELYQAAANVAIRGRQYLGLEMGGFLSIAFSGGDEPGTRLTLEIPTTEKSAKLACPKVSRDEIRDTHLFVLPDHPRNIYNKCVDELVKATAEFINGKRVQMSLPLKFSHSEDVEEEEETSEGRVFEFSARA